MKVIAHRGAWCGLEEEGIPVYQQNSKKAFELAVRCGFGIETDFRDVCGEVVISHNPPSRDSMPAEEFFKILQPEQIVAVNIKADGLASELLRLWKEFAPNSYLMAFDMSIPDTIGYVRCGFPFLERQSEYEREIVWPQAAGFWVDGFHSTWFDSGFLENLLNRSCPVCVVSPELHGRDESQTWDMLEDLVQRGFSEKLWLCTDKPFAAARRFGGH
jgi:hypothetical protein